MLQEQPPTTCACQAIRKAIDVPAIIAAVYNARGRAGLRAGSAGHSATGPTRRNTSAILEGAKKLLEEAGQGGGFSTRLTVLNKAAVRR